MWEPLASLLELCEEGLAGAGAALAPPCAPAAVERAEREVGVPLSPGLRQWLSRHDGGSVRGVRLFDLGTALARRAGVQPGLLPIAEREGRLWALDSDRPDADGEWPVVEIAGEGLSPAATNLLRFLLVLGAGGAEQRAAADPEMARHYLEWARERDAAGDREGAIAVLRRGLCATHPASPALLLTLGELEMARGRAAAALVHLKAACEAEPAGGDDDTARLDAAAQALLLVRGRDPEWERRLGEVIGDQRSGTAQYWRDLALRRLAAGDEAGACHAAEVVLALVPEDSDAVRLAEPGEALRAAAALLGEAGEAMDRGEWEAAVGLLRRAVGRADLGVLYARLAYALTQAGQTGAASAAERAAQINPALVEAWYELGDALINEARDPEAEKALREAIARDPAFALAWSKLAVALLNQGRSAEAQQAAQRGSEGSEDPAFAWSVLGDALMDQGQYAEAASAYQRSLETNPDDHWTLHQAALALTEAADHDRAEELFERALAHDPDGCHQTLADYADLKRRAGRIGDAVRLYKRAIKAAPGEPHYRRLLRDAQKELEAAPN